LRGPQGTLFGRNVTGGAVLLNTKKPGEELEGTLRYAIETGNDGGINSYYQGAIGGPITDNLAARLVLYYNDDDGKFENDFTGDDFGEIEQKMARGTVVWTPTDTTDVTVVYEYNDIKGDGPPAQSHTSGSGVPGTPVNNDRDDFHFSIDEEGFQDNDTNFVTLQIDQGVAFGDGTVTAIYGYRDFDAQTFGDIDAQPRWAFHAGSWTDATQNSFELRYNGNFADQWNVTVGGLYFDNDIDYHESRELGGFLLGGTGPFGVFDGGGEYTVESYTAFAQVDYDLNDQWTLTAGVNYSSEDKDVKIVSLSQNFSIYPNLQPRCNIVEGPACDFDFVDDESWDNWAPKVGATYHVDDQRQVYSHWTRGYRSGGYNLRNTSLNPADVPGPFDEEEVNSFEIGYKSTNDWGRLNAAVFYTTVDDMQREINLPGPLGTIQLVRNTADATLWGAEVDGTFSLTDSLLLMASVGYVKAEYDEVRFDLNGDGVVDGQDEDLEIPRAPEWSYSVSLNHDLDIGTWGFMTSRVSYSYRDDMAYTDNNLGYIDDLTMLDAGVDFHSNDGAWIFSLYGKNLLDEANHGGDTQLPTAIFGVPTGGTFSPLTAGIRYGAEVTYNF
jgi:iron complex outermembrane receptor protein